MRFPLFAQRIFHFVFDKHTYVSLKSYKSNFYRIHLEISRPFVAAIDILLIEMNLFEIMFALLSNIML